MTATTTEQSAPPGAERDPPSLALHRVAIDTYRENVAYLHRQCEIYRAEGFQALSKVEIRGANSERIMAVVNVVDDDAIVTPGQLGVSEEAFTALGLPSGAEVFISHAEPPASMEAVRRKIAGERLSVGELHAIARDIAERR